MTVFSLQGWQIGILFLPALLNLWGIWHAFIHEFPSTLERLVWVMVCVFVPILGGVMYVLFGRSRVIRVTGDESHLKTD